MGEVWRARDQRIGRDVAVKVLPGSFGLSDARVKRFEQEARAAGSLNHPGLVTIFDVGTTDGAPYIVMELLDGKTLRDVLDEQEQQPLPLRKAVDYAIQAALALAVAHEKGIIHRDLKPENLFVTADGRVKILDFGLAKLAEEGSEDVAFKRLTASGMVIGTPGYMSPEQVRAQPTDDRTDIFALGLVLYEMLSGRRAFDADSAIETMNAILTDDPPSLLLLNPDLPAAVAAIVRRCIEKNPRERLQSGRDLAFYLEMLGSVESRSIPVSTIPKKKVWLPRAAIGVAAAAALLGAAVLLRDGSVSPPARTYRQLTFREGLETSPTVSADGKTFAFASSVSGNSDIYVQRVDTRTPIDVTVDSAADDTEPALSPDGSEIAFRSEREGGGIFVMGVTGESVRRLTDFGHNPSWSPDGTRLVVSTVGVGLRPTTHGYYGELWIIDAHTGARRPLVQRGVGGPDFGRQSDAVQPSWSPHAKRIAFWGFSTWPGQRDIWTIDPAAPQPKTTVVRVTSDPHLHWNPVWSADGKYLYFGSDRDGTLNLWRVPMNEDTGAPTGPAEPLSLPGQITGNFSVSQRGDLLFTSVSRLYRLVALPFDAKSLTIGAPRSLFAGSQEILTFKASPNGQQIAFTTTGAQEDLFVVNADGTRLRQFTNDTARYRGVTWSPDGKVLYFYSNRSGANQIWSIHSDGSGLTQVTDDADLKAAGVHGIFWPDVAPDGKTLTANTDGPGVFVHLDRPHGRRIESYSQGFPPSLQIYMTWSPDGAQLLGCLAEKPSIYSLQTHRCETVLDRGSSPQWLADGRHFVFFDSRTVGLFDLDTRKAITRSVKPPPGVELDNLAIWPRLSPDGTTIYTVQMLEEGDVWMLHPEK